MASMKNILLLINYRSHPIGKSSLIYHPTRKYLIALKLSSSLSKGVSPYLPETIAWQGSAQSTMTRSTKCKKTRIYYKQRTLYPFPNNWEALVLDFSNQIGSQMILDSQTSNTKKQSLVKSRKGTHIIWIFRRNLTGHKI